MTNQDKAKHQKTCESVAYIPMTVSTPISLKPFIRKLPITASMCGNPVLKPTPWGTFILTQKMYVKVPIEISMSANIGNPSSYFGDSPIGNYSTNPKNIYTPNVVIDKKPCQSHKIITY